MKQIIITLIVLIGCANFTTQAQNTAYSQSSSGIWFEVRNDSLNTCRNPFPYIQYPIKKGKTWKWKLTIGSHWGDERWKTWTGSIVNKYKYKITDTNCEVVTPMGTLSCVKVEAIAQSRIGKTRLTAYYNDTYGFVKMDNTNIDGSRIEIKLVETNF